MGLNKQGIGNTKGMRLIRWSEEEQQRYFERAWHYTKLFPDMGRVEIATKAMRDMAQPRPVNNVTVSMASAYCKEQMLLDRQKHELPERLNEPPANVAPIRADIPSFLPTTKETLAGYPVIEAAEPAQQGEEPAPPLDADGQTAGADPMGGIETQANLQSALFHFIKEIILDVINDQDVRKELRRAALETVAPPTLEAVTQSIVWAERPEGAHKPRVLVVGGRKDQVDPLRVVKGIDLKHWSNLDDTQSRLKSLLPGVEHVIVITKFISHRTMQSLKGRSGFKMHYQNGGVAQCVPMLEQIAKEGA